MKFSPSYKNSTDLIMGGRDRLVHSYRRVVRPNVRYTLLDLQSSPHRLHFIAQEEESGEKQAYLPHKPTVLVLHLPTQSTFQLTALHPISFILQISTAGSGGVFVQGDSIPQKIDEDRRLTMGKKNELDYDESALAGTATVSTPGHRPRHHHRSHHRRHTNLVFRGRFFFLAVGVAFGLLIATTFRSGTNIIFGQQHYSPLLLGGGGSIILTDKKSISSNVSPARQIMEQAYARTYAKLEEQCPTTKSLSDCMNELYHAEQEEEHDPSPTHFPWWFRTMLRDGSPAIHPKKITPLHGPWHTLRIVLSSPSSSTQQQQQQLEVCALEKNGSTEWRKTQCALNNETITGNPHRRAPCQPQSQFWGDGDDSTTTTDRIVILRDPLTRFLSAFLDKCVSRNRIEQHCEPTRLFGYSSKDKDNQNNNTTATRKEDENAIRVDDLEKDSHLFFQAYVDLLPLKWNVHFFPQALYCNGLYRTLPEYKFVGEMGPQYHDDLHRIANHYGTPLQDVITDQFKLKQSPPTTTTPPQTTTTTTSAYDFRSRSQKAARLISEYYTPATVRKALEYFSIDYIKLGLELPDWVDEMLLSEESM